jgi:hypothetical protein
MFAYSLVNTRRLFRRLARDITGQNSLTLARIMMFFRFVSNYLFGYGESGQLRARNDVKESSGARDQAVATGYPTSGLQSFSQGEFTTHSAGLQIIVNPDKSFALHM